MKRPLRHIAVFLALFLAPGSAAAQISIEASDINARLNAGPSSTVTFSDSDLTAADRSAAQAILSATGGGQTYDFTVFSFVPAFSGTTEQQSPVPSGFPAASTFINAGATQAIRAASGPAASDSSVVNYEEVTSSAVNTFGLATEVDEDIDQDGDSPDIFVQRYEDEIGNPTTLQQLALPLTNTTPDWQSEATVINESGDGTNLLPAPDIPGASITQTIEEQNTVQGFGTLDTPNATGVPVIRYQTTSTVTTTTTVPGLPTTTNAVTSTTTFFVSETGDVAATITQDETGAVTDVSYTGIGSGNIPVELASFTATADGTDALLRWQTATETVNAGFYVEHQAPGAAAFADLGFVEGAGTTTEPQAYAFRAASLDLGTHRFRLRQVDLDGTATTTEAVTVRVGADGPFALTGVYPNPVRGAEARLTLAVEAPQHVTVTVHDALGRRVATAFDGPVAATTPQDVRVATAGLASGVYLVRVVGERFTATRRLTVVR